MLIIFIAEEQVSLHSSKNASKLLLPVSDNEYEVIHLIVIRLLKLINNSSSSNKGNHNREGGLDTRS